MWKGCHSRNTKAFWEFMENIKQLLLDQANKNDDIKQLSERAAKEVSAPHRLRILCILSLSLQGEGH